MTTEAPKHPALKLVEELKAKRRAELADAEEKEKARVASLEKEQAERFEAGVVAALKAEGAEWLAEFRSPGETEPYENHAGDTLRDALFHVPGHRRLWLRLTEELCAAGSGCVSVRAWVPAYGKTEGKEYTWYADLRRQGTQGFHDLADALIAAEVRDGDGPDADEPIPSLMARPRPRRPTWINLA